MPFSGPTSYLSTTDEFIAHWTDVNAALTPDLTLPGGTTLANLQTMRGTLASDITALEVAINVVENTRATRDTLEVTMSGYLKAFNGFVRGNLAGSSYVEELREVPNLTSKAGHWILSMDDAQNTWTKINATPPPGFTGPLLLPDGTTLAVFTAAVAALKTAYTNWTNAEQDADRELEEREATYRQIREVLSLYRPAVEGSFIEGHALINSIPRLNPLPGHTPEPSTLEGSWNGDTEEADFTWTPSDDPDFKDHQLRRSGPPYNTNTEVVVATFPPGTLSASTNAGLTLPGSSMAFKIYVRLNSGNEKGSNAVTITRIEG